VGKVKDMIYKLLTGTLYWK